MVAESTETHREDPRSTISRSEKEVDLEKTDVESQRSVEVVDEKGEATDDGQGPTAEDDFPEGGWRAWSVVLGVWIHQFTTFGYTNAYGVYNDYYVRDYLADKYTSSQISWIGSTQLLLVLSLGLISGRGFDTGYFRHLMIGGSLLFVFCLFMLSLTHKGEFYQVYLAQGVGLGAATGISYIPGLALVPHYFKKHRAIALGVASTGSALGGAIHPIYLNKLIHGPVGYHNACRISAGIIGGLLLIGNVLMKPRLPPRNAKGNTLHDAKVFLKEPAFVFMTMGTIVIYLGLYFPIFFLQLLSIERGVNTTLAFYSLVILNFASAFGRVIPNRLVPKLGVFNVMIFCVASCAILIFCFLALKDAAGVIIFAILYGFFSGGYASLLAPMIASVARSDSEIGARMGICFTFTGFGGLIGSPIAGALLTGRYIWWRPSLFSAICVLLGFTCFSITRFLIARRKGKQLV